MLFFRVNNLIIKEMTKEREKAKRIIRPWTGWALAEAGARTSSKIYQKIIGLASPTFAHTFLATFIIGLIQTIGGFVITRLRKKSILTGRRNLLGAVLFGFNAAIITVLPFTVFLLGGDIGINTFISTLSIIPGALIDVFFFKYKMKMREWLGVLIAVFAGYTILGWPSLKEFLALPLWVWLSFVIMILAAVNQGITQAIKGIDPFVKNFWGGLVTVVFAFFGLAVLNSLDLFFDFSLPALKFWFSSAVTGFIVVCLWTFNLMSYKGGANIAIKKLITDGFFLISSVFLGIMIFNEPFTGAKVAGMIFYFVAFIFMNKSSRENLIKRRT